MAYTLPQIVQTLTTAFDADWASYAGETVAFLDNQPDADAPTDALWARFAVRPSDTEILATGGRNEDGTYTNVLQYQHGQLWLQLIIPPETGMGASAAIIQGFREKMCNRTFGSGFWTKATNVNHYPPTSGNPEWMVVVEVPFQALLA
jgi:hypothetical protein